MGQQISMSILIFVKKESRNALVNLQVHDVMKCGYLYLKGALSIFKRGRQLSFSLQKNDLEEKFHSSEVKCGSHHQLPIKIWSSM
jgi:hypothetical protein